MIKLTLSFFFNNLFKFKFTSNLICDIIKQVRFRSRLKSLDLLLTTVIINSPLLINALINPLLIHPLTYSDATITILNLVDQIIVCATNHVDYKKTHSRCASIPPII